MSTKSLCLSTAKKKGIEVKYHHEEEKITARAPEGKHFEIAPPQKPKKGTKVEPMRMDIVQEISWSRLYDFLVRVKVVEGEI